MIGIILAGGQSERMGQDKALLKVNGKPLIRHVHDSLNPQVNQIAISGNQNYNLNIPYITDSTQGPKGPVGALYRAWQLQGEETSAGFFTVPVDCPNFPNNLCERLYGERSAIAVTPTRTHQAFGWWLYKDLKFVFDRENLRASLSLKRVAEICDARHVQWLDEKLFYNINTPNDLNRYLTEINSKL